MARALPRHPHPNHDTEKVRTVRQEVRAQKMLEQVVEGCHDHDRPEEDQLYLHRRRRAPA